MPRICFQIEQAHWFYEDFIREQNPHRLPSLSLRKFSKCIFDHCPLLWQYSGSHEEEFEDFLRYKNRVPVLGGILLDENWEKVFVNIKTCNNCCSASSSKPGKAVVGHFQEGKSTRMSQMLIVPSARYHIGSYPVHADYRSMRRLDTIYLHLSSRMHSSNFKSKNRGSSSTSFQACRPLRLCLRKRAKKYLILDGYTSPTYRAIPKRIKMLILVSSCTWSPHFYRVSGNGFLKVVI